MLKPIALLSAAAAVLAVAVSPPDALAGNVGTPGGMNFGNMGGGPHCKTIINNKWINIYKPVTINKNVDIWKSVNINNNIDIDKNVWINKSVNINKNININKGSVNVSVEASASASAGAAAIVYGGSYVDDVTVNKGGGVVGQLETAESCEMQEATVVKAIHAVCVAPDGREFPASHMLADTWIDSSYEGEIARCIAGAYVKIVIGEVVQSDQGMAGTYEHGQVMICAEHQALRHYKNGMLKCEAVVPVKDCTERTNLRKFGTGDMFFSYRAKVCATVTREARARALDVTGMSLEGGVGPGY